MPQLHLNFALTTRATQQHVWLFTLKNKRKVLAHTCACLYPHLFAMVFYNVVV